MLQKRLTCTFCQGKKNWYVIDSIRGARSSAILYSIAETAKANSLKPYEYFKYLLEEIPKHGEFEDDAYLEGLLPWSDNLPERCRKSVESEKNWSMFVEAAFAAFILDSTDYLPFTERMY